MNRQVEKKFLSVCIPAYEMRGLGHIYLKESFDILREQTFQDFEVVICDNSKDNKVKELCDEYKQHLDLKYFAHPQGTGLASNLNYVLKNKCCSGKFIKIIGQDDFLYDKESLDKIVKNLDPEKDHWLVTACIHTKDKKTFSKIVRPRYNRSIHLGNNTIGGLSVITIKNEEDPVLLDASMLWLPDCEYYKNLYERYGKPKIVNEVATAVRMGEHNITNVEATMKVRTSDFLRVLEKYESGLSYWYYKIIYFMKYPFRKLKLIIRNKI